MRLRIMIGVSIGIILPAVLPRLAMSASKTEGCKNIDYVADLSDWVIKGKVVKVEKVRDDKGQTLAYVDVQVKKYLVGKGRNKIITIKHVLPPKAANSSSQVSSEDFTSIKEGQEGYLYLVNSRDKSEVGKFFQPTCDFGVTDRRPKVMPQTVYYAP